MPVPLYIDHSADPRHDGYAIQTTERAIKQTTAFSRYKVSLATSRAPTLTLTHTLTLTLTLSLTLTPETTHQKVTRIW